MIGNSFKDYPSYKGRNVINEKKKKKQYSTMSSQITQPVENSSRDGSPKPPDLPLEKSVCRSGSNS